MTTETMIALAAAIIMACAVTFPALAQSKTAAAAMESIGRQPEAAGSIRSTLVIAMALMEALAIYGLLVALMLVNKI